MADKYDEQIARLLAAPNFQGAVYSDWMCCKGLFAFCTPSGTVAKPPGGGACGCLTMVKAGGWVAWTPELTAAVRADGRLPKSFLGIEPEQLPAFAEWQRRLDTEIRGGEGVAT